MTRKQEHDRIERLQKELNELRQAHAQRVADDCCCHHPHYYPAPYVVPWTPSPWLWITTTGTSGSLTVDNNSPFPLITTSGGNA